LELKILSTEDTLDEIKYSAECYFNLEYDAKIRIEQINMSMFEQYRFYLTNKFIPQIWSYRIICRNGKYYFGTI